VAFLEGGRIIEQGSATQILTRSAHVRTQAFLRRFSGRTKDAQDLRGNG